MLFCVKDKASRNAILADGKFEKAISAKPSETRDEICPLISLLVL